MSWREGDAKRNVAAAAGAEARAALTDVCRRHQAKHGERERQVSSIFARGPRGLLASKISPCLARVALLQKS